MQIGINLPLSQIQVLSNAYGLTNRTTKAALVKRIARNYDQKLIGVLTAIRRKADGKMFLIDGHHRSEGVHTYCATNNVDPSKFTVRVDLYEETDIPTGTTPTEFIDSIRKGVHDRVSETTSHEIQRHWTTSPWKAGFDAIAQEPRFAGPVMNVKTIVQARLIADQILARQAAGNTPQDCLDPFPVTPKTSVVLQSIQDYNRGSAIRTMNAISNWEAEVGYLSSPQKGNFRTLPSLVFAILVDEDAKNIRNPNIYTNIGLYMAAAPNGHQSAITSMAEYLHFANFKKSANSTKRVSLLGRDKYGRK